MVKSIQLKLKQIILLVVVLSSIFVFLLLSFNGWFGQVYAVEKVKPGTKILIPSAERYPQYGGNVEWSLTANHYGSGTLQRKLQDIWEKEGLKYDEKTQLCYISAGGTNWILVATSETFGEVGDYLKVHINHNGEELDYPMIICDHKNSTDNFELTSSYFIDGIHYGHKQMLNGVGLLDILEFPFYDKMPTRDDLDQFKDCEYIINGGSYFENPDGSPEFDITSVVGSSSNGNKMNIIDKIFDCFRNTISWLSVNVDNIVEGREDTTSMYAFREPKESESTSAGKLTYKGKFPFPLEDAESAVVTSPFGYRTQPTPGASSNHRAIDIQGKWHDNVLSIEGGVVTFSGTQTGYGNCIEIQHKVNGESFCSFYAHLSERKVQVGDKVRRGQIIAIEGGQPGVDPNPGASTAHHLHFEIRTQSGSNAYAIDPTPYILGN